MPRPGRRPAGFAPARPPPATAGLRAGAGVVAGKAAPVSTRTRVARTAVNLTPGISPRRPNAARAARPAATATRRKAVDSSATISAIGLTRATIAKRSPTSRRALTAPSSTSARDTAGRRRRSSPVRRVGRKIPDADGQAGTAIAGALTGAATSWRSQGAREPLTCSVATLGGRRSEGCGAGAAAREPDMGNRPARPPVPGRHVPKRFQRRTLGDRRASPTAARLPFEGVGGVAAEGPGPPPSGRRRMAD